jgi:hypothetical protein
VVQSQPRQIVHETLFPKYPTQKRAGEVAQVVACLTSKHKALSSNSSIGRKEEEEGGGGEGGGAGEGEGEEEEKEKEKTNLPRPLAKSFLSSSICFGLI